MTNQTITLASHVPSVAICIPTYNQADFLPFAVQSALEQTVSPLTVAVSDDASTDNTAMVMAALAEQDARICYVRHANNVGIAANNTRLMATIDAEFLVRLDSDDVLEPQYIEKLLPMMRAHARAGYGHVAIQRVDAQNRPISSVFLNRPAGYQEPEAALRAAVSGYRVAANLVMYRTAALRELNFFTGRPEFVEDYDMAARLAAAGWGNVYLDRVLARYRVWTDTAGIRPRRKGLEIDGYRRIFDEVLTPAFRIRDWDECLFSAAVHT
jgi:glycosyltransferase involved in cell wall biosynthesis